MASSQINFNKKRVLFHSTNLLSQNYGNENCLFLKHCFLMKCAFNGVNFLIIALPNRKPAENQKVNGCTFVNHLI